MADEITPLGRARVDRYLSRLGYQGERTPTRSTLIALHRCQLYEVPFENLDINLGRRIVLDVGRFFDKIVLERRGGFCYELNGLFASLLAGMGFRVRMLSARVYGADGTLTPEFDHMTLEVLLDEPWLADVGFGDSFVEPLRMNERDAQTQGSRTFRLVEHDAAITVREEREGEHEPLFAFGPMPHPLEAFADRCEWMQFDPGSPFATRRICSRATRDGRITIANDRLIVTENGRRTETPIEGESEFRRLLVERFGVSI